jgi:hypothetical protein
VSEKFDAIHYQMKAVLRSWVRDYGYPDVKNSSYRHPYEGRVCTLGMIVEKLTMLKPAELSLLWGMADILAGLSPEQIKEEAKVILGERDSDALYDGEGMIKQQRTSPSHN